MLPPIPGWDSLHPAIVHFPIALLLIAPVLVVAGLIFEKHGRPFMISAFILMLAGTVGAFVAVATGDAASELAERVAGVENVLESHEELAETTRNVFAALTTIFGAIVFVPMIFKKELGRRLTLPIGLAFLLFYGAGAVVLLNTAHEGGRLVHEFGVRAMMTPTDGRPTMQIKKETDDDDD
ncbi:MAG: hypothetical protein JSS81_07895 [Acidobacteria bacterium]|nr:hypothetical protein [Acidobacteriota bacterium]